MDKFFKQQVIDEANLLDKIDTLVGNVTNIAQQSDIGKVHETAIDAKRIWKSMKDSQEHGIVLNERQKLFGVPVTPFDHLTNLMKDFEPYKTLWLTASGNLFFLSFNSNPNVHNGIHEKPLAFTLDLAFGIFYSCQ